MKLALIADVHSNLEAFNAVLANIKRQRIKNILCIGDIVGYGADPNKCCDIIKEKKIICVQGNHDLNSVDLKKLEWYNQYAAAALRWTNKQLTDENKDFLKKLPKMNSVKTEGRTILLVHGSLSDPLYGYVYPKTPEDMLNDLALRSKSDVLAMGHTHLPMVRRLRNGIIINPGAIGQPRDNIPDARYAVLDTVTMGVSIIRVKYDIDSAARKIITAGLPRYLADRLYQGQ